MLSFFFPLFNVFGYEFSVFIDVVISLITGAYILSALKKININEKIGKEKLFRQIKISAFYFLIIPAVLGIIHSLFTFNCSLSDGILFYIVITVPGYLTGLSLAVFSYMLSKKFGLLIFLLLFAGILLIALLEFYFYPQVYFYNAVFGYYPGTIYDEALSVSWKLAGYRLINVIFFASLFLTSIRALTSQSRKIKTATAAVFVIIPIVFYFVVSPSMGYTTTFSRLDSELGGTAVTQHFEIHYPASLDLKLVKVIAAEHEYYYYNLKKFFGYGIDEKINSYVFENRHQKAELFGSANADVAKIWQLSVYTTYNDYNTILKHELAHCFSSKIGTGLFKAASGLNPALIEGIAVAADPVYDNHTIDYMARLAYGSGYKVYIPKLFSGFNFFGQTSTLSYIYAGAFSRYMIKKYGIHKFAGFYEGKDFKKVYDFGITKAADEYYSYLDSDKVSNRVDQANHYFGRGTIFTKVCPRFVSDRVNKGWNLLNSGKYISAGKLFKEVLDKTDNYPALTGYSECLLKDGKKKQAAELLRKRLSSFKRNSLLLQPRAETRGYSGSD